MNVYFLGEKYDVKLSKYSNGRLKITLVGGMFGPIEATENVPDIYLKENEVIIKNYSENQGIEEALINAQIIDKYPAVIYDNVYTKFSVFRLSGKVLGSFDYKKIA